MDFDIKPASLELLTKLGVEPSTKSLSPQGAFAEILTKAQQTKGAGVVELKATGNNTDTSGEDQKLMEACRELEAVFLNILAKEMRKTVPDGGGIKKSQAEELFTGMLDETLAQEASKGGASGLADLLYLQLKQAQEKES